jgi:hypothetical protein
MPPWLLYLPLPLVLVSVHLKIFYLLSEATSLPRMPSGSVTLHLCSWQLFCPYTWLPNSHAGSSAGPLLCTKFK